MSTLGERVEQIRKARGMSRARLAADADVSYTLVAQLELGRRDPSASNLAAIAAVLGVTVDALLAEEGGPSELAAQVTPRGSQARAEINGILDSLTSDDLVVARDILRAWAGRVTQSETNQGRPAR